MTVYANRDRSDRTPRRSAEPQAEFYDRVAGSYWDQVREVINEWWSHFPAHAQSSLRSRLLDRNSDSNVSSALWELYLHEMLLGSGCIVEVEPEIGTRGKSPDFLVTLDDQQFVVEAIWKAERLDDAEKGALTAQLLDVIDSVPSHNFYVAVTVNTAGPTAPPQRRLKAKLTQWLAELDPDQVLADLQNGHQVLPGTTWQEVGWSISFEALPRDPDKRGKPSSRTIGVYPWSGIGRLDTTLVLDAVKKKGSRYGELSIPFIVAVGASTAFPDAEDIEMALYGKTIEYLESPPGTAHERLSDGYWTPSSDGPHSNVTAVLVVDNPAPWTWAKNTPVLWRSAHPGSLTAPLLPTWGEARLINNRVEHSMPAAPAHAAIGLTANWPIGDAFPRHDHVQ